MRTARGLVLGVSILVLAALMPASSALAGVSPLDVFTVNAATGSLILSTGSVLLDDTAGLSLSSGATFGQIIELHGQSVADGEWRISIRPPTDGTDFTAGTTYQTARFSDNTHAQLQMVWGDTGCNVESGTLTVLEINRDDTNVVTNFAASYSDTCENVGSPVTGELRWASTVDFKAATVSPKSVRFDTQTVNTDSAPQTVTITAAGTLPVHFGSAGFGGSVPASFATTADTCSGATLAPGQSCTIGVVTHPTSSADQTAELILPDDTPAGARHVALLATGRYSFGALYLSPLTVNFNSVPVGVPSPSQQVRVVNIGSEAVVIGQVGISGPVPGWFHVSQDGCSRVTLAVGQQCFIEVLAHPLSLGTITDSLDVPNNTGIPESAALSAIGTAGGGGTFYPVGPARILDTRSGTGAPKAPLGAGGVLHVQVTGRGGVAASHVSAVVLNVTVTAPSAASYLAVYPTGTTRPTVSNLNFPKGWTGANSVTVRVGTGGKVDIYNLAGSTAVIADVVGYYTADGGLTSELGLAGEYTPTLPQRLIDTRDPGVGGAMQPGETVFLPVSYGAGTDEHVRAFAVNVTAVTPQQAGFLTTWNGVGSPPTASTLNFTPGAVVPNMAIVPTSTCPQDEPCAGDPMIGIYNGSSGMTHLIVDIFGFFDDGELGGGLVFHPINPLRLVDSRTGLGTPKALGPSATATVVAPSTVANADTFALALNLTAVAPTASTFLTIWPDGVPGVGQPNVSTLNAKAGQTIPNGAIVAIGPRNGFDIFNKSGTTNVLVDVAGSFNDPYGPVLPPASLGGSRAKLQPTAGTAIRTY